MIRDGTIPTISVEELRELLKSAELKLEKVRVQGKRRYPHTGPEAALAQAINELIIHKSETEY